MLDLHLAMAALICVVSVKVFVEAKVGDPQKLKTNETIKKKHCSFRIICIYKQRGWLLIILCINLELMKPSVLQKIDLYQK